MTDMITIVGNIASDPRSSQTATGIDVVTFRVASDQRRYDKASDQWVDGEPNWFTVSAYRALATNAAASFQKGDRVIVQGRLRLRAWSDGDKRGTAVEIDADALGHDLRWGRTVYSRTAGATGPGAHAGGSGSESGAPETADIVDDEFAAVPTPF